MADTIEITAVNVQHRWAITAKNECLVISDLYDADGAETHDFERAVCGVAKCPGGYITINFAEFEEVDCYH